MDKDEIIRMARESQKESFFGATGHWFKMEVKDLGRFYQAAFAAGAAHERETCAKSVYDSTDWAHEERDMVLKEAIAAGIRARGEK